MPGRSANGKQEASAGAGNEVGDENSPDAVLEPKYRTVRESTELGSQ